MIISITGPRDAVPDMHEHRIETIMRWMVGDNEVTEFWHGGANGVDKIGATIAEAVGIPVIRTFEAKWADPCRDSCKPGHRGSRAWAGRDETFCPAAGNYRNDEMMSALVPYLPAAVLLAFPFKGKITAGTGDCRDRALWYGVPCLTFPLQPLPADLRRPRGKPYFSSGGAKTG